MISALRQKSKYKKKNSISTFFEKKIRLERVLFAQMPSPPRLHKPNASIILKL